MSARTMTLADVQGEVSERMNDILALFKDTAKIAVLVRQPGKPTQDFIMTNDDLDEIIRMVERRKAEAHPAPRTGSEET